ncbi:TolC family protein [Roseivirga sp. BDSF3-8]|uniref:TolC family protein n=1 Tax=Roseivirga sp. BDSF3-8 TaxID=3241598 RepID=UPI0035322714
MHSTYIACILIFLFSGVAQAGSIYSSDEIIPEADTLRFDEAMALGLENNYGILLAKTDAEVAGTNYDYAKYSFFPEVEANGRRTWTRENLTQRFSEQTDSTEGIVVREIPNARSNQLAYSVDATWRVFDGLGMFIAYDRLESLRDMSDLNVRMTVENTAASIAELYHLAVAEQTVLEVLENNVQLSQERRDIAYYKYEVGRSSKQEYLQAQVQVNADSSAVLDQVARLRTVKVDLNNLLARDPQANFYVTSTIDLDSLPPLDNLRNTLVSENPSYQRALHMQEVADFEKKAVRAERYPTLDLIASYSHTESESQGFFRGTASDGFTYGAQISLPVFRRFDIRRREVVADLNIRSARLQTEQLEQELLSQLQNAWIDYLNNRSLLALERKNLELARENAAIALDRYKLGNATALESREAQVNAVEAESRLISAIFDTKMAEISLKRISGTILR